MKGLNMSATTRIGRLVRALCLAGLAASMVACANKDQQPELGKLGPGGGVGQRVPATPGSQKDFTQNVGDIVYFSTDQTDLTPEAQQTLANQARWLQQYAQFTITIEGHADERGTREYNIGLGAKRAQNVRDFLAKSGVNPQRIRTVSFGKERPVAVCDDISCWSQNRRAQTVLNNRSADAAPR